nr:hypothetical protein [uncultured bacterium]
MSTHLEYEDVISIENLFQAWNEFKKGKRAKKDVQIFARYLEDNLFELYFKLKSRTYRHGVYHSFYVHDPKRRHIHKASVEDRIVHHLLYKFIYGLFDKTFIYDSYSCRLEKGTHKAVRRLATLVRKVSKNYTAGCWVLKCDVKKFFASINHKILLVLLTRKIKDKKVLWLLGEIVNSFDSEFGKGRGVPLGNLTSQIFANIYLNEFDQFVKHNLKVKYYLRYADDFMFVSQDKDLLYRCINTLKKYLFENVKLELHPKKIVLRRLEWGIDFLGYIVLPHYVLPRTKTKIRILRF